MVLKTGHDSILLSASYPILCL